MKNNYVINGDCYLSNLSLKEQNGDGIHWYGGLNLSYLNDCKTSHSTRRFSNDNFTSDVSMFDSTNIEKLEINNFK